jgi:hypothetical protein
MVIPRDAGLPCGGQLLVDLKPAPLRMLVGKVERLAEAHGGHWLVLLEALQAERARRLARRQRPPGIPVRAPRPNGAPPAITVASESVL